ncbi:MAG: hypothetical protein AABY03_00255 [Nanoarchaeota archaeon]
MKKIERLVEKTEFEIENMPISRFIRRIKSLPGTIYSYMKSDKYHPTISGLDKSPEVHEEYERYHQDLINGDPTRLE